jgi:multicomponent Na+:H+ antiporter subunit C
VEPVLALLAGLLAGASVYLMLSRNLVKFLMGLVLVGNAANLVILAAGGLTPGAAALVPEGLAAPPGPVANALPQALVLTAIVIGFGLVTFALVLVARAFAATAEVDMDRLRLSEPPPEEEPG